MCAAEIWKQAIFSNEVQILFIFPRNVRNHNKNIKFEQHPFYGSSVENWWQWGEHVTHFWAIFAKLLSLILWEMWNILGADWYLLFYMYC